MPNPIVLISTIVRNETHFLDRWYEQLKRMVNTCTDIDFHLSVFENDSTDDSAKKLAGYDFSFFKSTSIKLCRLNLPFFIGGKHPYRTEVLAYARNQSIYGSNALPAADYVLVVEPDTEYTQEAVNHLLYQDKHYGRTFDILTGKSVHPNTTSIYDSWGTRKTANQTDWRDEDGQDAGLEQLWSSFNCLAMYKAAPIKAGHTFGGVNPRLGTPDCDTVVIAEAFRAAGYDQIYWDTNVHVVHHTYPQT